MVRMDCQKKWHLLILLDACFRAEKEPMSARTNTGIRRLLVMGYYQAGGGLVGVPPLDEPLVYGSGASGGVGGVFEAGDEFDPLVTGLLLGFASDLVAAVLPSDCFANVGVLFHCRNLLSWDVRVSYNRGGWVVILWKFWIAAEMNQILNYKEQDLLQNRPVKKTDWTARKGLPSLSFCVKVNL